MFKMTGKLNGILNKIFYFCSSKVELNINKYKQNNKNIIIL